MNYAALIDQLVADEEDWMFPYDDATGQRLKPGDTIRGNITIGVGVNLFAGITKSESRYLLENRIGIADRDLDRALPSWRELSERRKLALLNMMFNLGATRFSGFAKMIAALKDGDFKTAAAEMLASKWSGQVGQRAERLAEMVLNG